MDWPALLLPATLLTSKDSVIPPGGVQVRDDEKVCDVTNMVFATVVVTLGVACVLAEGVVWPFSTSIGFVVSTLEKAWMPPAAPVEAEKVQA